MNQITGRLEGWYYDEQWNIIWGRIYDDSKGRFPDGHQIHTSNIPDGRTMTFSQGQVVKTLNSSYILGKPLVPS